jgi:hypothetical protein
MNMKNLAAVFVLALLVTAVANADSTYTFTMNTSPLAGHGHFTLDLQFLDSTGSPTDLNNNTVTLTGFTFGGGSASGGGSATGGASGSLASGVMLTDTEFFNEYMENFTPGSQLSFNIDTTNLLDASGIPDLFTFAILDSGGNELPTTGFAGEFLDVNLAGGISPQVSTFGSAAGSTFSLAAPAVQGQSTTPAPEPAALWLVLAGLLVVNKRVITHASQKYHQT